MAEDVSQVNATVLLNLYSQLRQLNDSGDPKVRRDAKQWLITYEDIQVEPICESEYSVKAYQLFEVEHYSPDRIADVLKVPLDDAVSFILDNVFLGKSLSFVTLLLLYAVDTDLLKQVKNYMLDLKENSLRAFLSHFLLDNGTNKVAIAALYANVPVEITETVTQQLLSQNLDDLISDDEILKVFDEELAKARQECAKEHEDEQYLRRIEDALESAQSVTKSFEEVENTLRSVSIEAANYKQQQQLMMQKFASSGFPESTEVFEEKVLSPRPYNPCATHDGDVVEILSDTKAFMASPASGIEVVAVHSRGDKLLPRRPIGPQPKLQIGSYCYACYLSGNKHFYWAKIIDIQEVKQNQMTHVQVTVQFLGQNPADGTVSYYGPAVGTVTVLNAKMIAFAHPCVWVLAIGARVVALYEDPNSVPPKDWYAGIIAEQPTVRNRHRYLIFFDDGYVQYCLHSNVLRMAKHSADVCCDIIREDPVAKEFVRDYLMKYPEKAMVRITEGKTLRVESNGVWWNTRVLEVDASLIKVEFLPNVKPKSPECKPLCTVEWIYRGSTRLAPLFIQSKSAENDQKRRKQPVKSAFSRPQTTVIQFEQLGADDEGDDIASATSSSTAVDSSACAASAKKNQLARKSTAHKPVIAAQIQSHNKLPLLTTIERIELKQEKRVSWRKRIIYRRHEKCTSMCLTMGDATDDPKHFQKSRWVNPMLIPICCGWERQLAKLRERNKRVIIYVSPCGRRLRNVAEMTRYLLDLKSKLTIDMFSYDSGVRPFSFSECAQWYELGDDYSRSVEPVVKIRWINSLNHEKPPLIDYVSARYSADGVSLNDSGDFVSCCDCTDNCLDKAKCSCQQLTIKYTSLLGPHYRANKHAGYEYRRLKDTCSTGVFECNKKCKCDAQCMNRVVQNSLQVRLEIFKTKEKGWGVRAVDDIPKGTFLCTYAGQILNPSDSEHMGIKHGDEYHAALDFIEIVEEAVWEGELTDLTAENIDAEGIKEPVESESADSNPSLKRRRNHESTNNKQLPAGPEAAVSETSEEKAERWIGESQSQGHMPNPEESPPPLSSNSIEKFPTGGGADHVKITGEGKCLRLLYNETDAYIIDGKKHGNVGRYFNHSCSPNLFVQSVFVDTHDLRFPWVGFFTKERVRAGVELCWDYNYIVDSVPGKKIYCRCGSLDCRKRML